MLGPNNLAAPFVITSVAYNKAANTTTLAWTSQPAKTYTVWSSPNLMGWTKLPGTVPSQGTQTSFTDSTIAAGTPTRFYYVQEEP